MIAFSLRRRCPGVPPLTTRIDNARRYAEHKNGAARAGLGDPLGLFDRPPFVSVLDISDDHPAYRHQIFLRSAYNARSGEERGSPCLRKSRR